MHRFFLPPEAFQGASADGVPTSIDLGAIAHQLRTVLRMRPGMRVIVLDDSGWEYEVELVDLRGDSASARVCEVRAASTEPRVSLVLYQGLVKGQRFEWILQKGTELGVSAFVPTETRRTVARVTGRWAGKRARWERILCEAAEQSGRGRLPRLGEPLSFADACREAVACDVALIPTVIEPGHGILMPQDAPTTVQKRRHGLPGALRALDRPPQSVALLIGPEGGFDEREVALALSLGVQAVTLGPRTLRTETAAIAAVTLVLAELGEMG